MRSSHQKIGLISNKLFCWVGSLTCSHQTLRLNWTVLLSSDESCRKSVHTRKLYVNILTLRLNWSCQFLRFWTFQSQLSRDLLVSLGVNPFATATDWDCRPQAMAAAVRQTWSRLTTVIIIPSRLVWTRLRSDSTQLDKTDNAQNKKLAKTGRAQFSWDGSDHWRVRTYKRFNSTELFCWVGFFGVNAATATVRLISTKLFSRVGSFGENAP